MVFALHLYSVVNVVLTSENKLMTMTMMMMMTMMMTVMTCCYDVVYADQP